MNLVLRVKKRSQCEWATIFAIFMPFTFGLLIDGLGLPALVKYSIDFAWIFLLFIMVANRVTLPNKESRTLFRHTVYFVLLTLAGAIVALQSPLYYLWGFRNNFRFFVVLFSCIMFLKWENIEGYLRIFDILFYINFFVCLFQYFVQGYSQDYLGGIFGAHKGCNSSLLVFFLIVVTRSVLNYMNKKESFTLCAIKCAMALLVAALAELKVFFLMLILIVMLGSMVTRFTIRKYLFFVFAIIAVIVGVRLLGKLFPYFEDWFNLERIMSSASSKRGYAGTGDMNRLTGVPIVLERFLTTGWKRLFGLGLGNCDTSAFAVLNTPFYKRYGYLHYNWFSVTIMILETGITGLLWYAAFFVQTFVQSRKMYRVNERRKFECQMTQVLSLLMLIVIIYNSAMRTESAYMVYFVLALPFIKDRKKVSDAESAQ